MRKFCPKCGKPTEEFYDNLCLDCFLQKLNIEENLPKEIEINQCPLCREFFIKNKISTKQKIVEDILKKETKKIGVGIVSIKIDDNVIKFQYELRVNNTMIERESSIKLKIRKKYCNPCRLRLSGYYEAVLQIRKVDKKKLEMIYEMIERSRKRNKFAFISKEVKLKNGLDIYVGSKGVARKIARICRKNFGAEVKVSRKFYGIKDGKKVYRESFLVSFRNN